jgi:hypothetical protein
MPPVEKYVSCRGPSQRGSLRTYTQGVELFLFGIELIRNFIGQAAIFGQI